MSAKSDKYVYVHKETGKYISGIETLDVNKCKDVDNILLADIFSLRFIKKMGFEIPFYYASNYDEELRKIRKQKINKLSFFDN